MQLLEICQQAKGVKQQIAALPASQKNDALLAVADKLEKSRERLTPQMPLTWKTAERTRCRRGFWTGSF